MRVTMVDNGSSGHVGSFNYFNLAIAVTNVPPMITLTNPPNGGVFSAPATIMTAATASDGDGIGSVAFYANNLLLAADTNSPFSFTWSNVPAGNYTVTARAIDTLGGSATSTPVNISVVNGQAPYRALPIRVPGRVQAEDFDDGGENVAYHDTDSANNGAAYRNTAVDLESTTDGGGGFNVGWTSSGEWLEYSLFADVDGTYRIDVRVAAASPGATFHIDIDGVNTTGARTLPTTGGWQNWATVPISNVGISSGPHLMRFTIDSAVDEGAGGNVNWIRFTATSTNVAAPTLQFATSLPGTFADEADAVVNMSAKTITTRRPTNTRYYRVRATQTSRILGVRLADGNVVLTYE
jgi:hypothetical protein